MRHDRTSGEREAHERGLAMFLKANRRSRFLTSLAGGPKVRAKLTERLAHFADLDARFEEAITDTHDASSEVQAVERRLRELGCPDRVYVVSELGAVDGSFLPLASALAATLSQDAGSLISCRPGTLALFEGESVGDRSVLRRTGPPEWVERNFLGEAR